MKLLSTSLYYLGTALSGIGAGLIISPTLSIVIPISLVMTGVAAVTISYKLSADKFEANNQLDKYSELVEHHEKSIMIKQLGLLSICSFGLGVFSFGTFYLICSNAPIGSLICMLSGAGVCGFSVRLYHNNKEKSEKLHLLDLFNLLKDLDNTGLDNIENENYEKKDKKDNKNEAQLKSELLKTAHLIRAALEKDENRQHSGLTKVNIQSRTHLIGKNSTAKQSVNIQKIKISPSGKANEVATEASKIKNLI